MADPTSTQRPSSSGGRDWVWVSDEVYGTATGAAHGCPWGWARIIDIVDTQFPTVEADYRLAQNHESACDEWEPHPRTSYSAHNPTLTPRIAFSNSNQGNALCFERVGSIPAYCDD